MNDTTEGAIIIPERMERSTPVPMPDANPMSMLAVAVRQGWDLERLKQLKELNDAFVADQARQAFNEAFAAFKAEAVTVLRNKKVDAGPLAGKRYAELFSVVNAVTPALSKHGLSTSWKLTKDEEKWIEVTCTLKHAKGHFESVSMGGPPDVGGAKSPVQARASTMTFLERYTLKAVCGVAEEGDDNNGAGVVTTAGDGATPDPDGKKLLEACATMASLTKTWNGLPQETRKTLAGVMNECRARIKAADEA